MSFRRQNWILLLAAGACATLGQNGGNSLLRGSLRSARQLAPYRRICAVVDSDHEHHWRAVLEVLPERNLIKQPCDRGTLNALLLGVLGILRRDPEARIVAWQADHHVLDEETLVNSVRSAAASLYGDHEDLLGDRVLLLGMVSNAAAALGYIIPGAPLSHGIREVTRFAQKPPPATERDLTGRGALCNSLILAGKGTSIVECIRERYTEIVAGLAAGAASDTSHEKGSGRLHELYRKLPALNLSDLAGQGGETAFCVLAVPACGWTDTAAPRRVSAALH